jgi:hypothetical protein
MAPAVRGDFKNILRQPRRDDVVCPNRRGLGRCFFVLTKFLTELQMQRDCAVLLSYAPLTTTRASGR